MAPGSFDFILYKGTSFNYEIRIEDNSGQPITGLGTPRMYMAPDYVSQALTHFNCIFSGPGVILINLTTSKSLLLTSGRYVYNLETVNTNGEVTRILDGVVTVPQSVKF